MFDFGFSFRGTEQYKRWLEAEKKKPIPEKMCPLCGHKLDGIRSGSGLHSGYGCYPCGFGGNYRAFTIYLEPAYGGINPCGIVEETWKWQIEQRKKASNG